MNHSVSLLITWVVNSFSSISIGIKYKNLNYSGLSLGSNLGFMISTIFLTTSSKASISGKLFPVLIQ
nr:MAG TPA: hypothetical protein [Crassvirales sp.]